MNKSAAIAGASVLGVALLGGSVFGSVKLASFALGSASSRVQAVKPVTKAVTASPSAAAPLAAAPASPAPAPATQVPSAAPAPAPAPAAPVPAVTNPSAVVTQFYTDISNGDYQAAWSLGGDNIGGGDYSGWVAGYEDTTSSVSVVTASDYDGDTAYAEIDAVQLDGTEKTYDGTYTVENGVITSADISQTS